MLKIVSLRSSGDLQNEHLVMIALRNCDLGDYVVIHSDFIAGETRLRKPHHIFCLPSRNVRRGDIVVVWTRAHQTTQAEIPVSSPLNLFWGLSKPLWANHGHFPCVCQSAVFRHLIF
jgi:hypothetical protein